MLVRCNACGHVSERDAAVGGVCQKCGKPALDEVERDEPVEAQALTEPEVTVSRQCAVSAKCAAAREARTRAVQAGWGEGSQHVGLG